MPMKRSERVCKECIYHKEFNFSSYEDGHNPTTSEDKNYVHCLLENKWVTVLNNSFCSHGNWERCSDLSDRLETYTYDDDEFTWRESLKRTDGEFLYVVVDFENKSCSLHEDKKSFTLQGNQQAFKFRYDDNDAYWYKVED